MKKNLVTVQTRLMITKTSEWPKTDPEDDIDDDDLISEYKLTWTESYNLYIKEEKLCLIVIITEIYNNNNVSQNLCSAAWCPLIDAKMVEWDGVFVVVKLILGWRPVHYVEGWVHNRAEKQMKCWLHLFTGGDGRDGGI